jgi:hypothetical protein
VEMELSPYVGGHGTAGYVATYRLIAGIVKEPGTEQSAKHLASYHTAEKGTQVPTVEHSTLPAAPSEEIKCGHKVLKSTMAG